MKEKFRIGLQCLFICVLPAFLCDAQAVHPAGQQISMKWGHVDEVNGVRKVVSTEAEYDSHNQHGPITFYEIPFTNGTFSLSWKRDLPQKINLVFETEENGKPTHLFKVFVNGTPNKDHSKTDRISFVTYTSPGRQKRRPLSGRKNIMLKRKSGIRRVSLLMMMLQPFVSMTKRIQSRTIAFGRMS